MGQVLHGSARTTEAVRRAIQRSEESVRALAQRHGISPTTVQKWRKRASVSDAPMGPKAIHSTVLTTEEEAMIVAFTRSIQLLAEWCIHADNAFTRATRLCRLIPRRQWLTSHATSRRISSGMRRSPFAKL